MRLEVRKSIIFHVLAIVVLVLFMLIAVEVSGQVCGPTGCTPQTSWRVSPDLSQYPPGTVYDSRSGSIYSRTQPKVNPGGWQASTTIAAPTASARSVLTSPPKAGAAVPMVPIKPTTKHVAAVSRSTCSCPAYHKAIWAKLSVLEAQLERIVANSTCDNTDVLAAIALIQQDAQRIVAVAETQDRIANAIAQLAQANLTTNEKLDAALQLLQNPPPGAVALTVHSANNTPASYVDTSTVWAAQRDTGLSHAVLVVNSGDDTYTRLHTQYLEAASKFPALKLVDVMTEGFDISPTPQIVLYFLDEREPQVIEGDRLVAAKLRDLYTQ